MDFFGHFPRFGLSAAEVQCIAGMKPLLFEGGSAAPKALKPRNFV
jgi:hypothetical protein